MLLRMQHRFKTACCITLHVWSIKHIFGPNSGCSLRDSGASSLIQKTLARTWCAGSKLVLDGFMWRLRETYIRLHYISSLMVPNNTTRKDTTNTTNKNGSVCCDSLSQFHPHPPPFPSLPPCGRWCHPDHGSIPLWPAHPAAASRPSWWSGSGLMAAPTDAAAQWIPGGDLSHHKI